MEQSEARRLARTLSEVTSVIHVALTESAFRGQWPAAEEVWMILPLVRTGHPITTEAEAIEMINRTG